MGFKEALEFIQDAVEEDKKNVKKKSLKKVLEKLVKRFNKTEKIYWSQRSLALQHIRNAHQHSVNPSDESPINRRYCHGDALFENGRKHRIHYLIEEKDCSSSRVLLHLVLHIREHSQQS